MNKKLIKKFLPALVILVAVIVSMVIANTQPNVKKKMHRKALKVVETMVVKPMNWMPTIKTQGTVEASTITTLSTRVSGEVTWVSDALKPGGFFEKGDVLIKIDAIDYELAIKSAEAELAEAQYIYQEEKAQSIQAKLNWKRLERKEEPNDLVLRKPQMAKAKAVVNAANARLKRAALDLKRTKIVAPYTGRVQEQYVDIGQYVSTGKDLVKVFAIDKVEVRLPLTDGQREQVMLPVYYHGDSPKTDDNVSAVIIEATVGGDMHEWEGQLVRIEGVMSRETRQQYIVVNIDKPYERSLQGRPPLEIGQLVKARVKGRVNESVFIIPRAALHAENMVMLVDDNNMIQRREVKPIAFEGDKAIIRDGLVNGERLSVLYLPFITNNTQVKLAPTAGKNSRSKTPYKKGVNHE